MHRQFTATIYWTRRRRKVPAATHPVRECKGRRRRQSSFPCSSLALAVNDVECCIVKRDVFLRFVQSLLVEFQNWRPTALRLSSCVCVGPSEMNAQREGIFLLLCTTLVIPAVCPSSSKSTVTNTKRKKKSCLRLKKRKG